MKRKVAILGFGVEGQSVYRYLSEDSDTVISVRDQKSDLALPGGVRGVLGEHYLEGLDDFDLVVRSPGVKPWDIKTRAPTTSATALFFERCPSRIIGITGTKGKSTTAALCARILGEGGWRTWVSGNSSQLPLDFLPKIRASHLVVLELSSFQLIDLRVSPHIAAALMIVPEHLKAHRSAREYVSAFGNIFWHQLGDDLAIYNAQNEYSAEIAQLSPGTRLPYMAAPGARVEAGRLAVEGTDICSTSDIGLIGEHNMQNVCAAVTTTWDLVKRNPEPVRRAVSSFSGLVHRLEFVAEVGGTSYYDDSFSTTPETAIAAMGAFREPKILILGGSEKQSDYAGLAREIARQNVRHVILIGETAKQLQRELDQVGFIHVILGPRTMSEIVATARGLAQKGDIVLLSPACSSFDLFAGYQDRGDQFKAAVRALAAQ